MTHLRRNFWEVQAQELLQTYAFQQQAAAALIAGFIADEAGRARQPTAR